MNLKYQIAKIKKSVFNACIIYFKFGVRGVQSCGTPFPSGDLYFISPVRPLPVTVEGGYLRNGDR